MQAVPVSPESFASRKALPEVWRGLRDEVLSDASGVHILIREESVGRFSSELAYSRWRWGAEKSRDTSSVTVTTKLYSTRALNLLHLCQSTASRRRLPI